MRRSTTVNARGLSCPGPTLETKKAITRQSRGTIVVFVDSGTAQDNVTRFAQGAGWEVTAEEIGGGGCKLTLTK